MDDVQFLATKPVGAFREFTLARELPLGSVAVVFGAPGSGKTSFVIDRFRHAQELMPQGSAGVLVLAASRESAALLRDNLLLSLGDGEAVEGSLARTVSSLAFGIVRNHAIATGQRVPELISGAEQDSIIHSILSGESGSDIGWPDHITQVTLGLSGFRAEVRNLIAVCQEYGIGSAQLAKLDSGSGVWMAAAEVFARYEQLLASSDFEGRLDSPSLVNLAISLISAGENVPSWREVIVDDAQELTPSAARLIEVLCASGAGLTLVGDPDVATLGFRQADPRIMSQLATRIAAGRKAKSVVEFLAPAGSTPALGRLLQKVSSLIPSDGGGRQRRGLLSALPTEPAELLTTTVLSSKQTEAEWLAYQIREAKLLHGLEWGQVAVIARTRQQLEELERMLAVEGVPARIVGAQQALRDEFASRELLELARSCFDNQAQDAQSVERLIRSPFCGLDSISLRRFRRAVRRLELEAEPETARNSDELLLEAFANPESLATVRGIDAAKVRRFLRGLEAAREIARDQSATIEDLLWILWKSSGLAETWTTQSRGLGEVAAQAHRNLDAIVQLFAAANRFAERNPGGNSLTFLEAQLSLSVAEDSLSAAAGSNSVALLTPAGLVGRRFGLVAVASLIEGIWPNLKPRNSLLGANQLSALLSQRTDPDGNAVRAEMADELRMFYKAIGASDGRVIVSSYLDEDEQVSQFVGHATGSGIPEPTVWKTPALTLRGTAGFNRRKLAVASSPEDRVDAAINLARLAEAGVAGAHPDDWFGLLDISTTEPLFSFVETEAESIDEYSDSGDHILVRPSQLEAFVKCPLHWFLNYHGGSTSDFAASVGTLVHRALELATSLDEESLWRQVESGWHTLTFESAWLEQAERRKARRLVANLSSYLQQFAASGSRVLAAEADFEFELGRARVRGKVDRIEVNADGGVVIVDLKTGSKAISKEDALKHAQLGLYQLAVEDGAFQTVEPLAAGDVNLEGAKLLMVAGDNFAQRIQPSIQGDQEARRYFESLVAAAAEGMAMPNGIFVANVSSHCDNDKEFGSCAMHIARAVSHVGK